MKCKIFFSIILFLFSAFFLISEIADNSINLNQVDLAQISPGLSSVASVKPDMDFGNIPLSFITNKGQVNSRAVFYAKTPRFTLWLTKKGLVFDHNYTTKNDFSSKLNSPLHKRTGSQLTFPYTNPLSKRIRDVSRLEFVGSNLKPEILPLNQLRNKVNYFRGKNSDEWFRNIPTSQAVLYKNLYNGIDLKVYGFENQIEYDWIIAAGSDPGQISFTYQQVNKTRIDSKGNIIIRTDFGEIVHKCPVAYQEMEKSTGIGDLSNGSSGNKKVIPVNFKRINNNTFGFEVGEYDTNRPLIIDPIVLTYSTYFGGGLADIANSIAVDNNGYAYITGVTDSTDFPVQNRSKGKLDAGSSGSEVFVAKFDTHASGAGSLVYSTYIGGDGEDSGLKIAIDSSGNPYITGFTYSTDYPTMNQYQEYSDIGDSYNNVFVTKLSITGDAILYSTYLGGDNFDEGYGIALDSSNNVYVTGITRSTGFPTLNHYQDNGSGSDTSMDVFVTKLDTSQVGVNSLLYSTYLRGNGYEEGNGIVADNTGIAYITGYTDSTDFPTRNPFQANLDGSFSDAFVTKVDTTKVGDESLLYSTYLGGEFEDAAWSLVVDDAGCFYVCGTTGSSTFPIMNAYQSTMAGLCDAFVTKFSPTGDLLIFSTYIGGSSGGIFPLLGIDEAIDICLDSEGCVLISGRTTANDFPVLDAFQSSYQGGDYDGFITKLSPSGESLIYSTFFGGNNVDELYNIAIDNDDIIYVTGFTYSTNFPVLNSYQSSLQGMSDSFVTRFVGMPSVITSSVSNIGLSSAVCGGEVARSGGGTITARGICWSASPNPTLSDNFTTNGSGLGTFSSSITGLTSASTYYVRAYATNSYGSTGYGNEEIFTTDATISGSVTDGSNPLQNVTITFSHDNHVEYTDASGNYSYIVPYGITTTIIPSHIAVSSWSPSYRYLNAISANMSNQDFQAMTVAAHTVSGTITTGGSGLENVVLNGLPGNPVTDASGFYTAVVLNGWSGTVTPALAGYIFTPQIMTYTSVTADQSNQNYTAISGNPVISGTVRSSNGSGLNGVMLTFSNSGGSVLTDANGNYSNTVLSGWSGSITPSLSGYSFTPETLSYTNVTTNQANQDFTGTTSTKPVISGIIWTLSGSRLPGVTLTVTNYNKTITSDSQGNYWFAVNTGWSGKVSPSKEGYEFIPVSRSYTGVSGNQFNNDFIAIMKTGESPEIQINRKELFFGANTSGSITSSQSVLVGNSGEGTLNWSAASDQTWLKCSPASGSNWGVVSVSVADNNLKSGTYTANITISSDNAVNSPQTVSVTLKVYNSTSEPFGVFSTPLDNSTVYSSIPITGWALDDVEVADVKIYRESGKDLEYIGSAVFVEGARPDVQLAFPGYPKNYRAGWGYMMLTNFLPNNGNGTFTIHAIATDKEGNSVDLGKKTIHVDNANASKPFGTIDFPEQGGSVSGSDVTNWGWVLTPKPNTIPTNGSTIFVYIDGVKCGNPDYNLYREDIATLLPDYNNSNGAVGKFLLDSTQYENGVHTIQWIATDDAGNQDGIGSRYFSILNLGNSYRQSASHGKWLNVPLSVIGKIPGSPDKSVSLIDGTGISLKKVKLIPNSQGISTHNFKELKPVEFMVGNPSSKVSGYTVNGSKTGLLPVGSTLDNGVFYWSPGPGYCGKYHLVFIVEENNSIYKTELSLQINPLF